MPGDNIKNPTDLEFYLKTRIEGGTTLHDAHTTMAVASSNSSSNTSNSISRDRSAYPNSLKAVQPSAARRTLHN